MNVSGFGKTSFPFESFGQLIQKLSSYSGTVELSQSTGHLFLVFHRKQLHLESEGFRSLRHVDNDRESHCSKVIINSPKKRYETIPENLLQMNYKLNLVQISQ